MTSTKAQRMRRGVALAACAFGLFGAHAAGAHAAPTFGAPLSVPAVSDAVAGALTRDVAVADVNLDGYPDLLVTSCASDCDSDPGGSVSVLLNNGSGKFDLASTFKPPDGARRLAVGDLNGDGYPDLVVGGTGRFDVYHGAGGPHAIFNLAQQVATPAGSYPDFAIVDLDGDGRPDVIDTLRSQDSAEIRLTDSAGTVGAPRAFATGSEPVAVAFTTAAGKVTDIGVANSASDNVSIYNYSSGLLIHRKDVPAGPRPVAIAGGYFLNYTSAPDFAVALGGGGIALLAGQGTATPDSVGAFGAPRILPGDSSAGLSVASSAGEQTGPFANRLLVTDQASGSRALWADPEHAPAPDTRFAGTTQKSDDAHSGIPSAGSAVSDLNGDGALDYVVTDSSGAVDVYLAVPTVDVHGISFDDQAVGSRSTQGHVTVTNTGSAPLSVRNATLAGQDASDFTITDDGCSGETVAAGSSCTIAVRFAPSASGGRSATLTLSDNTADGSEAVPLSGTGITSPAPVPGPQGQAGRDGRDGQPGPAGAQGPAGPAAPAPRSATFVCTPGRGGKVTCLITYTNGPTGSVSARLARRGRTLATGRGRIKHGALSLKLHSHGRLRKGKYQLKLRLPHHRTVVQIVTVR